MNWLESILYSLITAAAEIMPVSSQAHQTILQTLFGFDQQPYLLHLFVHLSILIAVLISSREYLVRINHTSKILAISPRRRKRQPDFQTVCLIRFLRVAAVPMLMGFALMFYLREWTGKLPILALILVVNGILIYIPAHLPVGNKDSRGVSGLESLLVGVCSGIGAIPGLSRIGLGTSAAVARGADPQQALNWSILLSIPALVVLLGIDIFMIVTEGVGVFHFIMVLQYLICSIFAYISAYISLNLLRFMAVKTGLSVFAYYCWGAAMFAFILYMI